MKKILSVFILTIIPLVVCAQVSEVLKKEARLYREEGYRRQSWGDLKEALKYYQKAVELDPYYYEAYNDIGVVLEALGDREGAIRMYKKALELNPSYVAPYTNLALLYEEANDIEKATYYWKKRYLLGKKGEYWREKAVEHLVKLGTYPELKRELLAKKILDFSKEIAYKREQERLKKIEEAKLHLNLALDYLDRHDYDKALKELQLASLLQPPDPTLQLEISHYLEEANKGKIRYMIRNYVEQALDCLERDDYNSAAERLKEALSVLFSTQK